MGDGSRAQPGDLIAEQSALYDALRDNRYGRNVRLEQDYVGFDRLQAWLSGFCGGEK